MPTYVFVPLSDEILFNHPELIKGPLLPYNPDSVIREENGSEFCSVNPKPVNPYAAKPERKKEQ